MHIEPQRQLSLTGYSVLELYNEVLRGEPTCRLESRLLRLLT